MDDLLVKYSLQSADMEAHDLNMIVEHLKKEIKILKQKTADNQKKLSRLGLDDENLSENIKEYVEKLVKIQCDLESSDCDIRTAYVSHATEKRNFNKIIKKLKHDTSALKKSNQNLQNDIVFFERELKKGKAEIANIPSLSNDEINAIKNKISDYESKLRSFEKYPWMTESHLNLKRLQHEVNELKKLEDERDSLLKRLEAYHGLTPSIEEATAQLLQLKKECDKFSALIMNKKL